MVNEKGGQSYLLHRKRVSMRELDVRPTVGKNTGNS